MKEMGDAERKSAEEALGVRLGPPVIPHWREELTDPLTTEQRRLVLAEANGRAASLIQFLLSNKVGGFLFEVDGPTGQAGLIWSNMTDK